MSLARSFLDGLSPEQRAAALDTAGPVLLLAGAGSGKTRTLTARFVHLVTPPEEGGLGADPSSVMMVTFTNKAAREMRERIEPLLEDMRERGVLRGRGEPWIGTFHGLSLRILRIEAAKAGLGRNFSIFDEADARSLVEDVASDLGLAAFDADAFFVDLEIAKARLISPEMLRRGREALASGSVSATEAATWSRLFGHFRCPDFLEVYAAYQASLQEQNAVDFNDLLNRVTRLMKTDPDVADAWRSSFRHYLVDEVQDINRAQVAWLAAFAGDGGETVVSARAAARDDAEASDGLHEVNGWRLRRFPRPTLFFVGDDDQSIYGFRGSQVSVMRSLRERFPGTSIHRLEVSHRCPPAVLAAADGLVSINAGRLGKTLRPPPGTPSGSRIRLYHCKTPGLEMDFLRREAAAHVAAGRPPSEFAVLVRTRDLAKHVARSLRDAGLAVVEGRSTDLRRAAEVRDLSAYAAFIVNPQAETALRRILNRPARGLGPTSIARVARNAKLKGWSFLEEMRSLLDGRGLVPEGGEAYGTAFLRSCREFGTILEGLRAKVAEAGSARAALEAILRDSGYMADLTRNALHAAGKLDDLAAMQALPPDQVLRRLAGIRDADAKATEDAGEETPAPIDEEALADKVGRLSAAARRIGNIALLLSEAEAAPDLPAFVQEATLETGARTEAAGIQVMTVHAAKGLEFDEVRLPFWMQGILPHERALASEEETEEERRLAYVAMTRARRGLAISYCPRPSGEPHLRAGRGASRFVKDLRAKAEKAVNFVTLGDAPPKPAASAPSRPSPAGGAPRSDLAAALRASGRGLSETPPAPPPPSRPAPPRPPAPPPPPAASRPARPVSTLDTEPPF